MKFLTRLFQHSPLTTWRFLVVWKNVSLQYLHFGLGGILYLVLWLVLARTWGAEFFGSFNFIYTYVAMWGIFFDFGLDLYLTRFISSRNAGIPVSLLQIKAVVICLGSLLCLSAGIMFHFPHFSSLFVLVLGIVLLSFTHFLFGLLRGIERLDIEAGISLLQKVIFVASALAGVLLGKGVLWVSLAYLGSHLVGFCLTLYLTVDKPEFFLFRDPLPSKHRSLKLYIPFWLIALLTTLGHRADIFMLQFLGTEQQIGLYAAGFRIVEGCIYFEIAFIAGFFPRLVQSVHGNSQDWILIIHSGLLLLMAGLILAAGNYLLAPWAVPLLFGPDYDPTIRVLQLLGLSLPFLFLSALLGHVFVAQRQQYVFVLALLLALMGNGIVDSLCIPRLGLLGAVFGFWTRELLLLSVLALMLIVTNPSKEFKQR